MNDFLANWQIEPPARRSQRIAEIFFACEILFQLILLVPALNTGPLRIVWRTGIFAASLLLFAFLPGKTRSSAPCITAIWIMVLLGLEVFNPNSNTFQSAIAECVMTMAVIAPLFWMSRLRISLRTFQRVALMFWGFYSVSAFVGILQVFYPGRFEPKLSPIILSLGDAVVGLKIVLANGQSIFRPMGLTDTPGGAATAGMWAILFGLGFLLAVPTGRNRFLKRIFFLSSMMIGMMCIYLSQVRVMLFVVAVWFITLFALLFWRRRWRQFSTLMMMVVVVGAGGLILSLRLGGSDLLSRLNTLTGSGATGQLYVAERGDFLDQAFLQYIPNFPLGAGLGRWGMMNTYFGDNSDPSRGRFYVEIQWQAWVLDGGVPLLVLYLAMIGFTMVNLWRYARRRGPLWMWAALCLAYDAGALALCFDYTAFTGEAGLEFWFLNALVLAAAACAERQIAQARVVLPVGVQTYN